MAKSRLREHYENKLRSELQKDLGLSNVMQVPKVSKIVINVGVKEAVGDSRVLQKIQENIGNISGQKTVRTLAKKSIAGAQTSSSSLGTSFTGEQICRQLGPAGGG